jgi:hypothetical protein
MQAAAKDTRSLRSHPLPPPPSPPLPSPPLPFPDPLFQIYNTTINLVYVVFLLASCTISACIMFSMVDSAIHPVTAAVGSWRLPPSCTRTPTPTHVPSPSPSFMPSLSPSHTPAPPSPSPRVAGPEAPVTVPTHHLRLPTLQDLGHKWRSARAPAPAPATLAVPASLTMEPAGGPIMQCALFVAVAAAAAAISYSRGLFWCVVLASSCSEHHLGSG